MGKSKKPMTNDKIDKPVKPTRIDLPNLVAALRPIPVAERNYDRLVVGSDGALFYLPTAARFSQRTARS